eukprot:scaffold110023_cov22-Tisochrysis_lutea.AAC.1
MSQQISMNPKTACTGHIHTHPHLEESKLSVRASAPGLAHNTSKPSCQCLLRPSRLLIRAHMSSSSAGERSSRLGAVATTPARAYGSSCKAGSETGRLVPQAKEISQCEAEEGDTP